MKTTKTLASKRIDYTFEIEREQYKIRFWDYESRRSLERVAWINPLTCEVFVRLRGEFWLVSEQGRRGAWAVMPYREVSEATRTVRSEVLNEQTEIRPAGLTLQVWDEETGKEVELEAWLGDNSCYYVILRGQVRPILGCALINGVFRQVLGGRWDEVEGVHETPETPETPEANVEGLAYVGTTANGEDLFEEAETPNTCAARDREWTPERKEYVRGLADEMGADPGAAFALADLLGPNEDRDGLVVELEDYALMLAC